jgi:hypothetical protein
VKTKKEAVERRVKIRELHIGALVLYERFFTSEARDVHLEFQELDQYCKNVLTLLFQVPRHWIQ